MNPEERFEALAREHSPRVLAYLRRRVTPPEEAADLLQGVLGITWRKLDEVPEETEAALCWMLVVARGELNNQRRAQARRHRATQAIANALRLTPPPEDEPEDALALREALARLSSDDQEVLTLTFWDGLTSAEVALVLGISAPAVRRRLTRARERLGRLLVADAPGPVPLRR